MSIVALKRWHWVVVGLVLGLVLWGARRWSAGGGLYADGEHVNDRGTFEWALLLEVQPGKPRFKDVRVHRQWLDDGSGAYREVDVVTGLYCAGRPDPVDNQYHWRAAVFVAPVSYRPASDVWELCVRGGGDRERAATAIARYEKVESPSVVDFLRLLNESRGVRYSGAWWNSYPALTWVGGSVLMVGVVWPTFVNLLAFGRFNRPSDPAPAIDLGAATPATPARPAVTDEDLELAARLAAEIEAGLAAPTQPQAAASPGLPGPAPVVSLTSAPFEPAAAAASADETDFTADPDDFYPTALKAAARHPHHH